MASRRPANSPQKRSPFHKMSKKRSRGQDPEVGLFHDWRKSAPPASGEKDIVSKAKGDKKLSGKVMFLDVKDVQRAFSIEQKLRKLDAVIETFLSKDINFVITSSSLSKSHSATRAQGLGEKIASVSPAFTNTSSPYTPPAAPSPTYLNAKGKLVPLSRGQAMAQMARARNRSPSPSSVVSSATKLGIKIIPVDVAEKWLDKELKRLGLKTTVRTPQSQHASTQLKRSTKCRQLKDPYLKIESTTAKYRPQVRELPSWPHIFLDTQSTTCPFDRKGAFEEPHVKSKKSGSVGPARSGTAHSAHRRTVDIDDSSHMVGVPILTAGDLRRQQEKQKQLQRRRGYCECCRIKYEDIGEHLKDAVHQEFARDKNNYELVDELMSSLPATGDFLRYVLLRHCKGKATRQPSSSLASAQGTEDSSDSDQIRLLKFPTPSEIVAPEVAEIEPQAASGLSIDPEIAGFQTPTYTPQYSTDVRHSPRVPGQEHPMAVSGHEHPMAEPAPNHSMQVEMQHSPGPSAGLSAVVKRRPGARSAYGSPRDKWNHSLSPRHTPRKVRERSMVFGTESIGSLRSVSEDASAAGVVVCDDGSIDVLQGIPKSSTDEHKQFEISSIKKNRPSNQTGASDRLNTGGSSGLHDHKEVFNSAAVEARSPVKKRLKSAASNMGSPSACEEAGAYQRHCPESKTTDRPEKSEEQASFDVLTCRRTSRSKAKKISSQSKSTDLELALTHEQTQEAKDDLNEKNASVENFPVSVSGPDPVRLGLQDKDACFASHAPTQAVGVSPGILSRTRSSSAVSQEPTVPDTPHFNPHDQPQATSQQVDVSLLELNSLLPTTPRRSPRKRGPRTSTPTRSKTPQKNKPETPRKDRHTPQKQKCETPQKDVFDFAQHGGLRTPQREDQIEEDDELPASPEYLQHQTHSNTPLIVPVRSLRSMERAAASGTEDEDKTTPKKKPKRMVLGDSEQHGPGSASPHFHKVREGRVRKHRSGRKQGSNRNEKDKQGEPREVPRYGRNYKSHGQSSESCSYTSSHCSDGVSLRLKLVKCGFSPAPQTTTKKVKLSQSWQLLSDHSISRLLHSEPGDSSFTGFEGNEGLPSDLTYELASEVELTDDETREWVVDGEDNVGFAGDQQDDKALKYFIPAFSSPGKRSDSSWEDACDMYLSQSVEQQLQGKEKHVRSSPRKAVRNIDKGSNCSADIKPSKKILQEREDCVYNGMNFPTKKDSKKRKRENSKKRGGIENSPRIPSKYASPNKMRITSPSRLRSR